MPLFEVPYRFSGGCSTDAESDRLKFMDGESRKQVMGWRGTFRTLAAVARRMERGQHRKRRQLQQRQQHLAKLGAAQRAAHEVEVYENFIDLITSVHRDCGEVWDWRRVTNVPPPAKPEYSSQLETTQRQREAQRRPGFWDRVTGQSEARAKASEQAIQQAKAADQARNQATTREYETKLEEWQELQRMARGVLAGQATAFKEVLEEVKPFEEIKEIGRNVQMHFTSRYVEVSLRLHGSELVPREIKTLLKAGTVSKKPASATFLHQTYQKHVCGCALRAASELFAVLPLEKVLVHGIVEMLNPQTGNQEPRVILSVLIPQSTFATLNLDKVDPAECMRSFVHHMAFAKLKGFTPVTQISLQDYESVSPQTTTTP